MKKFLLSFSSIFEFLTLKEKEKCIFFYSESKYYRDHFIDLIEQCIKKSNKNNFCFITSDYEDYNFHKKILKSLYFKNGFFLYLFFSLLKCKCIIMTLTDLGNHIAKSKSCYKYIYFFHSLSSTFKRYTKEAFINYDIILTNGQYQKDEILEIEQIYKFPKKEIINMGYFYLDNILKKAKLNSADANKVLFAPSWNYNKKNLLEDHGLDIINILLKNKFSIILRPHPEHYKRSLKTINKIEEYYKNNNNFKIDTNSSNLDSLEKSQILITDNSAIDMEFGLIFERPIIYIQYSDKIHNEDYLRVKSKNIDDEFKNSVGNKLGIDNLNNLPNFINTIINNNSEKKAYISKFKEKYITNLNNSSEKAADFLIKKFINN